MLTPHSSASQQTDGAEDRRVPRIDAASYVLIYILLVPALLAALAWTIQYSALDLKLEQLLWQPSVGSASTQHSLWLYIVGYQASRSIPIFFGSIAFIGGFLPVLRPWRRILLSTAACVAVGPLLINTMKNYTSQHCPTQIREFGGIIAYAADQAGPFWASSRAAAGRCLPSGHAGGGYALLSLYFAGWAAARPAWRWIGLAAGLAVGLVFSLVRIAQGAHFTSATVWSATIDWTVCALIFLPLLCRRP